MKTFITIIISMLVIFAVSALLTIIDMTRGNIITLDQFMYSLIMINIILDMMIIPILAMVTMMCSENDDND